MADQSEVSKELNYQYFLAKLKTLISHGGKDAWFLKVQEGQVCNSG